MSKLNEFISSKERDIDRILSTWYAEGDTDKYIKKKEIIEWLKNSEFNKQTDGIYRYEDAFRLLDEIKVIKDTDIQTNIEKLSEGLKNYLAKHSNSFHKIGLFPLGDSASEGGSSFLKLFIESLGLDKRNAPQGNFTDYLDTPMESFVFIDDFIGSGKTIIKYIEKYESQIRKQRKLYKKFILLSLFCFKEKVGLLEKKFDYVGVANFLTESDKIFSHESSIFEGDHIAKKRVESWCQEIGNELYEHGPLGYDNNQTLIVFRHNTPNNSLPILWAGPMCESDQLVAKSWNPVFPRRKQTPVKSSSNRQQVTDEASQLYKNKIPLPTFILQQEDSNILNLELTEFLDNGNYNSAINILLQDYPFEEIPIVRRLEIIKIEQKAGYINEARRHLNSLLEKDVFSQLSKKFQAQIQLLDLRIACQENNFPHILRNYKKVIGYIEGSLPEGLKCGVYHRAGIGYAIKREQEKSKNCFANSLAISERLNIGHSTTTCKMYSSISKLFRGIETDIENPIAELVKCGEEYFIHPTDKDLWKFNRIKSSVQCLFAEASALLYTDNKDKGMLRLTAANLFAYLVKSHPKSEGYAELLALLPEGRDKELITLAMKPDGDSQNQFQRKVSSSPRYLLDLKSIVPKIVSNPTITEWRELRSILAKSDKKYSA